MCSIVAPQHNRTTAGIGLVLITCRGLVALVLPTLFGIKKTHRLETLQKGAGQDDGAIAQEIGIHNTSVASLLHLRCDGITGDLVLPMLVITLPHATMGQFRIAIWDVFRRPNLVLCYSLCGFCLPSNRT